MGRHAITPIPRPNHEKLTGYILRKKPLVRWSRFWYKISNLLAGLIMQQMDSPDNQFDPISNVNNTFYPVAFFFARAAGLSDHDAENIAREVILKILEKLRESPPPVICKAFVVKITHGLIVDMWRKNKTERLRNQEYQDCLNQQNDLSNPVKNVQDTEELKLLLWAIEKLDLPSQGIIQLYLKLATETKQVSCRAMARILGKAQLTVKIQLERIFSQIAGLMASGEEGKEA